MNFPSEAIPGTEILKEGSTYLYFGGTAYLGMQRDPEFLGLLSTGILRFGSHWGASRVGNVELPVFRAAERALASWLGSEACLTLSSGFLAARLASEYFMRHRHPCFFSPNCHEALLPPGAERQADWDSLTRALQAHLRKHNTDLPIVFTDSMGGPGKPGPVWGLLRQIPKDCILVADDSHGIGMSGPDGSGSWKPLEAMGFKELVLCGSLGKALGVTAGMLAGSARRLAQFEKTPFFAGASPAPPAGLWTLSEALATGMYRTKWNVLTSRVKFFQERVRQLPCLTSQEGYPVWSFRNPELVRHLLKKRILITDFQYPAEGVTASPSRIVVTAAHGEPQLEYLTDVLSGFKDCQ